ncbi:MAG: ATP-dependent Clp protease proteolytic subunit [Microthrixaceae bacterium]
MYSLLLRNNIIFLGTPIDDQVANVIVAQLLFLNHEDPDEGNPMYINSPGGVIYAGLAIYDTMQIISNPISTVAVGVTASFGTVLLTARAPRVAATPCRTRPSTCTSLWAARKDRQRISKFRRSRSCA